MLQALAKNARQLSNTQNYFLLTNSTNTNIDKISQKCNSPQFLMDTCFNYNYTTIRLAAVNRYFDAHLTLTSYVVILKFHLAIK